MVVYIVCIELVIGNNQFYDKLVENVRNLHHDNVPTYQRFCTMFKSFLLKTTPYQYCDHSISPHFGPIRPFPLPNNERTSSF